MGSSHVSVLAACSLILILTLTLGASRSASQKEGFQSINCGGEAYNDSQTTLFWTEDPLNNMNNDPLYGNSGKVNSSLKNITNVMTTLRYFPNNLRNKKFCYSLEVSNGTTYLVRASFLYGNYDGLNKPPSFVLIFNYDQWTDVNTSSSTIPIMHELTFVSKEHNLRICVAPHLNSNQTPFISTLEIRLLGRDMYTGGALSAGSGLMLWQRINYGAKTEEAIRYPDDPYDRIWEANTTGTIASTSTSNVGSFFKADLDEPPAEVMATAITTTDSKGNLSFTYDGFGGVGQFRISIHLEDPVENASSGPRTLGLALPNSQISLPQDYLSIAVVSGSPILAPLDQSFLFPMPLQITLFPVTGSPRGPLLNAIELFNWTPQSLSIIGTVQEDVETITMIQTYFKLMGYGQGDPCMPEDYSWTWISCNQDIPRRIIAINLPSFNLSGDIPSSINNLTSLQKLDLSNNMLSGQIPDFNHLLDLESLDLHKNNLNGELPQSLDALPKLTNLDVSYNNLCVSSISSQTLINFTFVGNTGLCNCVEFSNSSILENEKKKTRKYMFSTFSLGALYLVSILTLLVTYKAKQSGNKKATSRSPFTIDKKGVDDPKSHPFVTRIFTYNEIRNATLDFTTLLGEGGFGKVYHGLLPTTGEAIAVKMLTDASKQGLKEFYNEVGILSRVRHKNLVSLIGYCVEDTYMLIYEYIEKGNLRDLLYGEAKSIDRPLPWRTRLNIALDASQGLEYLHMGCDNVIIHRDVKSSNILLTHKMQAKVADFGLSRFKEGDNVISHVSTINVVGTIGYLDPSYYATNQFTDKSDVYSFGIVLFELICGRAPIDMINSLPHIVDWVTPAIMQDQVELIVDPMLKNGYKVESMRKVVDVAFSCVNQDRMKRPKMRQVSQNLQNALEVEMDHDVLSHSQDFSGESSATNRELSTLRNIKSFSINLEP